VVLQRDDQYAKSLPDGTTGHVRERSDGYDYPGVVDAYLEAQGVRFAHYLHIKGVLGRCISRQREDSGSLSHLSIQSHCHYQMFKQTPGFGKDLTFY
jgi:hypothetical protein